MNSYENRQTMNFRRLKRGSAGILTLTLMLSAGMGCNKNDPPPAYNYDLGDSALALPPTSSSPTNVLLASGQADFPAFRKPTDKPASSQPSTLKPSAGSSNFSAVEKNLRDMITEYNEFTRDAETDADALLDYFVEEQYDILKPWMEAGLTTFRHLTAIRNELTGKLPDQTDRITRVFDQLDSGASLALTLDKITVKNDSEASSTMDVGSRIQTIFFVVVDEEWYLKFDGIEKFAAATPMLSTAVSTYGGWLSAVQSGQISADQTLQIAESAADGKATP